MDGMDGMDGMEKNDVGEMRREEEKKREGEFLVG